MLLIAAQAQWDILGSISDMKTLVICYPCGHNHLRFLSDNTNDRE